MRVERKRSREDESKEPLPLRLPPVAAVAQLAPSRVRQTWCPDAMCIPTRVPERQAVFVPWIEKQRQMKETEAKEEETWVPVLVIELSSLVTSSCCKGIKKMGRDSL